jgi:hypothetical protein
MKIFHKNDIVLSKLNETIKRFKITKVVSTHVSCKLLNCEGEDCTIYNISYKDIVQHIVMNHKPNTLLSWIMKCDTGKAGGRRNSMIIWITISAFFSSPLIYTLDSMPLESILLLILFNIFCLIGYSAGEYDTSNSMH